MKLLLKHIGVIQSAEIELDGVTVLAGFNGTGKSTVSNKMDIWKKALNSIFIARMIINQKISLDYLSQHAVFFVVHKDMPPMEMNDKERILRESAKLAGTELVLWELKNFKDKLYREIHTIPASEFRTKWLPTIWEQETIKS